MDTKRRRNDLGMGTPVAAGEASASKPDQFAKLPDELAVEILSRSATTLNEAARCSSLLGRRWRYMWQLIDCPVLDFDKSDDDGGDEDTPEAQWRFVDRVDQAIGLVQRSETRLDALRIGFKLFKMEDAWWRWIQFGLAARVKRLTLLSYLSHDGSPVPLFTPDFLRKQDLSRLEVLEFQGLSEIPRGTLDHIFSNCPSLHHLSLNDCTFHDEDTVITVCHPNSNKLQSLTFCFPEPYHRVSRIEILSAPSLHTLEVRGDEFVPPVEFGDDIPQLRDLGFCDQGHSGRICIDFHFPWSRSQFDKFAPRLQFLKYDVMMYHFEYFSPRAPEWLLFEKLAVLNLSVYIGLFSSSMLDCTALLRAAPMLRRLSISFINETGIRSWDRAEELPTWRHHSLQVLQLQGVHPTGADVDPRKPEMELAVKIIMNSPSLNQVFIDTRSLTSNASREPHQVDADILGARMELESQLQSHAGASQIHFIYR